MATPQFDPVLKQAVLDIKEVMKKHDIGGVVILNSRTHGEYALMFPEWAGLYEEESNEAGVMKVRIKFKASEKEKSKGAADFLVTGIQMMGKIQENFHALFNHVRANALVYIPPLEIVRHTPDMNPK